MKYLITVFALVLATMTFAQKDVTKFLGIPVDGTKAEMMQKLKAKGFTYKNVLGNEFLEGEFNGNQVRVYVITNNNKVCRIMICDDNEVDESAIKIRFNKLVSQFENNKRYVTMGSYTIPDDEIIRYKMTLENKRYEAAYYQKTDTLALQNQIREELLTKYTKEQMENPTEELAREMQSEILKIGFEIFRKKVVWFMISERYGKYSITMYYDNEYNRANGDDL
jgi:hypothetical protein